MPEILDARRAVTLSPGARPLWDVDAVAFDDLVIDGARVFVRRDDSAHAISVAVEHVGHGQLLHESFDRGRFAAIHFRLP